MNDPSLSRDSRYVFEYPDGECSFCNMTRSLWVTFSWENVRTIADKEPVYICTGLRPIEQAEQAARDFDIMWSNSRGVLRKVEDDT